jgi:hypothetical protein
MIFEWGVGSLKRICAMDLTDFIEITSRRFADNHRHFTTPTDQYAKTKYGAYFLGQMGN